MKKIKIWTIGTSTRSIDEFLHLLALNKIEAIADVRRFPTSRLAHFKKDNLEASLNRCGVQYSHVPELGGYRKGGYKEYMNTEEFNRGLLLVQRLASEKRVAIMCAEKLFFRCHRRYIADALKQRPDTDINIIHIVDEKRSYEHQLKRGEHKHEHEDDHKTKTLDEF
jgi:uncharacterized protein (DUF488 family)